MFFIVLSLFLFSLIFSDSLDSSLQGIGCKYFLIEFLSIFSIYIYELEILPRKMSNWEIFLIIVVFFENSC